MIREINEQWDGMWAIAIQAQPGLQRRQQIRLLSKCKVPGPLELHNKTLEPEWKALSRYESMEEWTKKLNDLLNEYIVLKLFIAISPRPNSKVRT